ncbi:MAG: Ppx/GppA family phosphatase [Zoogloeaceae bacterium]|jgi:exopolyphosphatase/guanosine-5'-triphosphate,3'-diphosphate pyrophosphatase|nr:Ppx/GppA family phosphatase [Zoogloeaceae bacterium]
MDYETLAAVDLGSNSFRLQVGRVVEGQIYTMDAMKETVRMAAGLTPEKRLDAASMARGLEALSRFGERLIGFPRGAVRVVATNTLRVAKNANEFLKAGEAALGFPIDVIAGREEARLIYMGAVRSLPPSANRRLIVDIGGGSTEFVIGRKSDPILTESLYMGGVGYSLRFFPDGKIDKRRMKEAQAAASQELETIVQAYCHLGWKEAFGTAGTARALYELIELNGLNPKGETGITRPALEKLAALAIKAGSVDKFDLPGIRPDRAPVLPGGLAILLAVFEALEIERMDYADGALRLGVLYDLLGRAHQQDMRDVTVRQFMRRYHVDKRQATRVRRLALHFLHQLEETPDADERHFLSWAARLHEIGISVAHNGYHKHGAYILTYADMPGFSSQDQKELAALVLGHRGKLEKLNVLPEGEVNWRSLACLRLASLLCRARTNRHQPECRIRQTSSGFTLEIPSAWLSRHAWTAEALREESRVWEQAERSFRVKVIK